MTTGPTSPPPNDLPDVGADATDDAAVLAALAPDTEHSQLDLLVAGDECAQLAATHARAGEQPAPQATRLIRIPRQRS